MLRQANEQTFIERSSNNLTCITNSRETNTSQQDNSTPPYYFGSPCSPTYKQATAEAPAWPMPLYLNKIEHNASLNPKSKLPQCCTPKARLAKHVPVLRGLF